MTSIDSGTGGRGPRSGGSAGGRPVNQSVERNAGWREDVRRDTYRGQPRSASAASGSRSLEERAATSVRHSGSIVGVDRWATLFGGGLLLAWGLRRGGLGGLMGLALGGTLAWAGANGRVPSAALSLTTTEEEDRLAAERGWSGAAATAASITVLKPAEELYRRWKDQARLATILGHVDSIEPIDEKRARWTVRAPGGRTVSWVSRITDDQPGRRIAWESEPGGDVRNAGWVEFADAPGKRGTEVKAMIVYEPPAGQLGRNIARLFREEPGVQLRDDLRRFKQQMETGGAATAETPKPA